ncbi:MAG TPA: PAS domain S-box protein, partial [Longimicrobiales bacterium]
MGDITSTRSEEFFRLIVENVRDYAIFALDANGRVASWNAGAERIKGYTEAEILGAPYAIFFPPEDAARGKPQRLLATAVRDGRVEDEGWRVRKDGTRFWADAILTALRDHSGQLIGFAKITRDLTERRLADIQARELLREQVARENAEVAMRRMELLARASAALGSSFDYHKTIQEAVSLAVPALGDFCAVDLIEGDGLRRLAVAHRDAKGQELAGAMGAGKLELAPSWRSLITRHIPEITAPPQETAAENPYGILRLLGVRTAVLAPVNTHGRLFGTLVLGMTEP